MSRNIWIKGVDKNGTQGEKNLRTVAVGIVAAGAALAARGAESFPFGVAIVFLGLIVYYVAHKTE